MGLHFGNLATVRGIVFFRLSPHEQKPFAGMLEPGFRNMVRRFNGRAYRVTPFLIGTYLIYKWGNEENARLSRKNPKDFENDV